jgi:hypothetical protein
MSEQPVQIFGRPDQTSQFRPSRRVQFGPPVRTTRQGQLTNAITPSSDVCLRPMSTCWKALEVYFQMDPRSRRNSTGAKSSLQNGVRCSRLELSHCISSSPLGAHSMLGFTPSHDSCCLPCINTCSSRQERGGFCLDESLASATSL